MGSNLLVQNTGLDHLYLNGFPIIEAIIDIDDVYKRVARKTSLAVKADPYFSDKTQSQKMFSELHGEGDRITKDFLKEGAEDIRPVFIPLQRLIPEGVYDVTTGKDEYSNVSNNFSWANNSPTSVFVTSVDVKGISGSGTLTFFAGATELGTVSIPHEGEGVSEYLTYYLGGYLGGYIPNEYFHNENYRNDNLLSVLSIEPSNVDLVYDVVVNTIEFNAIGWHKAILEVGDVKLPTYNNDITISYLCKEFTWSNPLSLQVTGVTVRRRTGDAYVIIRTDDGYSDAYELKENTIGINVPSGTSVVEIILEQESTDFTYDLVINTVIESSVPSPRFEFDSNWNQGKIIYRWQLMDTRDSDMKLDYTHNTSKDIRIDTNLIDEVKKYLEDALECYVMRELYNAIGYDKKYAEYIRRYARNRQYVAYYLKNDTNRLTQYNYAGA